MAEATGDTAIPKLGFEADLREQTKVPMSGRRVLVSTENYNPLTFVERGRAGSKDYYQQKFQILLNLKV